MKKTKGAGLSDLQPKHYAVGGAVKSDEYRKPSMNPGATFTGSPKGTGLEAPNGGFTSASANAFTGAQKPAATLPGTTAAAGSAVAPRTVQDARMAGLSAFLGGDIAPRTPPADIAATSMPKPGAPAATPANPAAGAVPGSPGVTGGPGGWPNVTVPPNITAALDKSGRQTGGINTETNTVTEAQADALNDTIKYALPDGSVVGRGGKITYDLNEAFRRQLGRTAAGPDNLDELRGRVLGGVGLSDIEAALNDTPEGREYSLMHDPLNDADFARRAYRSLLGREPDNAGLASLLGAGADRRAALEWLSKQPEVAARNLSPDELSRLTDEIIGQGDVFKPGDLPTGDDLSLITSQFTAEMGRPPTEAEIAKLHAQLSSGALTREPGAKSLLDALRARRAAGFAAGGRVRRWYGGPGDEAVAMSAGGQVRRQQFFADGGRVTARDRFIDEQVNGKPAAREVKKDEREEPPRLGAEEKALLEKYRRKSLLEKAKAGLSSLLN